MRITRYAAVLDTGNNLDEKRKHLLLVCSVCVSKFFLTGVAQEDVRKIHLASICVQPLHRQWRLFCLFVGDVYLHDLDGQARNTSLKGRFWVKGVRIETERLDIYDNIMDIYFKYADILL